MHMVFIVNFGLKRHVILLIVCPLKRYKSARTTFAFDLLKKMISNHKTTSKCTSFWCALMTVLKCS